MGQGAHSCGIGDLKSRPAVMSRQSPIGIVHVVVCKSEEKQKNFNFKCPFFHLPLAVVLVYFEVSCPTCAGGTVGVVAGVGGRPVTPQTGVALAVGARRVARGAAELRGAAARADGCLAGEEPTSNCEGAENEIEALQHTKRHIVPVAGNHQRNVLTLRVARLLTVSVVIRDFFMVTPAIKVV